MNQQIYYYPLPKSELKSFGTIFAWISGALGLVVDLYALVELYKTKNLLISNRTNLFSDSTITIGEFTFEWIDVTLTILIYVSIIFIYLAINSLLKDKFSKGLALSYIPANLALLWYMVFFPFGTDNLYRQVFEGSLAGFILVLLLAGGLHRSRGGGIIIFLFPLIITPAIILIEKGLDPHLGLGQAIKLALPVALLGSISPILLFAVTLLVILVFWIILLFIVWILLCILLPLIFLPTTIVSTAFRSIIQRSKFSSDLLLITLIIAASITFVLILQALF